MIWCVPTATVRRPIQKGKWHSHKKPPLNYDIQWGHSFKGGRKNSVYKVLPGPPVSNTIRVNIVANTISSMPIYIAPINHSPPRLPINTIARTVMAAIHCSLFMAVSLWQLTVSPVPPPSITGHIIWIGNSLL